MLLVKELVLDALNNGVNLCGSAPSTYYKTDIEQMDVIHARSAYIYAIKPFARYITIHDTYSRLNYRDTLSHLKLLLILSSLPYERWADDFPIISFNT